MNRSHKKLPIAVLGAGPAGLAAAWSLAQSGVPVIVIEREDAVGGLCRTLSWNGYGFDLGGHRFLTDNQEILSWIRNLMSDRLVERPRFSQIVNRDRWYDYPPQWADALRQGGPLFLARAGMSYMFHGLKRSWRGDKEVSFEDWVIARFGRPLYDLYFREYSEKLWGMKGSLISSRWAAQRVTVPSLARVIREMLPGKDNHPKTYASRFYYPVGGIGQICEALAKDIRNAGGNILLSSKAIQIDTQGDRVLSVWVQGPEKPYRLDLAGCVSTLPLPHFIRSLSPSPSDASLQAATRLSFRGLRFLFLSLNCAPLTPNTWIYVPEKRILFGRIQETAHWEPSLAPKGTSGLVLEIPCTSGDKIWNADSSKILDRCLSDLRSIGMDIGPHLLEVHDYREPESYPIYHLDYEKDVEVCLDSLRGFNNLITTGRQGLFRYNNMDHSLDMGRRAAAFIQGEMSRQNALRVACDEHSFE